jgi:hypothetical protein
MGTLVSMSPAEQSILLKNGVSIEIITDAGKSQIVYFSKPVRGIELTREESASLGNILMRKEESPRPTEVLRLLMKEGFFNEPKDLKTVRMKLGSYGMFVKPSPLNTLLNKLVARKEMIRTGKQRMYQYRIPNGHRAIRRT